MVGIKEFYTNYDHVKLYSEKQFSFLCRFITVFLEFTLRDVYTTSHN